MNKLLIGQSQAEMVPWREGGKLVHRDIVSSLGELHTAAFQEGFQLEVASGYRSFDNQLNVWNGKASGKRIIYDDHSQPIDVKTAAPDIILTAIQRWSALPGLSRHHWGTDIDIYDASAMPKDYQLQLTIRESSTMFKEFHRWLDQNMSRYGFFRPYDRDRGGVNMEPWHLSFKPLSEKYLVEHRVDFVRETLMAADISLKTEILARLPQIFDRYFLNVARG